MDAVPYKFAPAAVSVREFRQLKVVQKRLGHSSAQFTLNTYAHVLAGMQESAVKAISAMLQGQAAGK